ncbi:S8 family serine peptidase [Streptomyces sp. NBC_00234]|uniref:S8 family serine peptidase n=1 Tax=Streptomyces sp. NBC_00234 TaxID=2903638 RepID=UPI002E2866B6|nr:S8 family serine peptidase [Streptomyces sp. NBC_00234]
MLPSHRGARAAALAPVRTGLFRTVLPTVLALLALGVGTAPAHADTVLSEQWHLTRMQAQEMWRTSTGAGVTVALVDTRVREVPELSGRLLPGKDFRGGAAGERNDRGTTAASVIAGTGKGPGGQESAFGLAPGAKVLPLEISDGQGTGNAAAQGDAINTGLAPALRYAADSDAKIISVSLSASSDTDEVRAAVDYARSKGKLIFAAVGESLIDAPLVQYPAATPGVVGVSAVGKDLNGLRKAGAGLAVDLSAPGEDIISACAGSTGLCRSEGTAVATALASASAALIWSEHPAWTANQVLRVMVGTAGGPTSGAVRNDFIGYGIVRPRIALKTPGDPGAADRDPIADYRTASPTPRPSASASASVPQEPSGGAGSGPAQGAPAVAASDGGHSGAFWLALAVGAAGLLCVGVAVPPLLADRRRARPAGLSRP